MSSENGTFSVGNGTVSGRGWPIKVQILGLTLQGALRHVSHRCKGMMPTILIVILVALLAACSAKRAPEPAELAPPKKIAAAPDVLSAPRARGAIAAPDASGAVRAGESIRPPSGPEETDVSWWLAEAASVALSLALPSGWRALRSLLRK